MAKLIHIDATTFKIARPGVDVDTAKDKDLILSLSGQNAQLIGISRTMLTDVVFADKGNMVNTYHTYTGRLLITYPDYGSPPFFIGWPIQYRQNYDYEHASVTTTTDGPMSTKEEDFYDTWINGFTMTPARTGITNTSADFNITGSVTRQPVIFGGMRRTWYRICVWGLTVGVFRRKVV